MAEQFDPQALERELSALYPEHCRRYGLCPPLELSVTRAVIDVSLGERSAEAARAEIAEDAGRIAQICTYGQVQEFGDPPRVRCRMGVLCEFPPRHEPGII